MILQILAVLVLGLLCGSELNVAAFSHPAISRQPLETQVPDDCSRFVHPSSGGLVFAYRSRPHQQPDQEMTPQSLPNDWKAQEHRWDVYHWLRTSGLVVA